MLKNSVIELARFVSTATVTKQHQATPALIIMDNGPTSLFDSYESDFKQIVTSIRGKLDTDAKEQKGGEHLRAELLYLLCCAAV